MITSRGFVDTAVRRTETGTDHRTARGAVDDHPGVPERAPRNARPSTPCLPRPKVPGRGAANSREHESSHASTYGVPLGARRGPSVLRSDGQNRQCRRAGGRVRAPNNHRRRSVATATRRSRTRFDVVCQPLPHSPSVRWALLLRVTLTAMVRCAGLRDASGVLKAMPCRRSSAPPSGFCGALKGSSFGRPIGPCESTALSASLKRRTARLRDRAQVSRRRARRRRRP